MTRAYEGSELALFAGARHWKRYVGAMLAPFVGRHVLEVGAGLGANIPYLHHDGVESWVALEPDAGMATMLAAKVAAGALPGTVRVIASDITALDPEARFDTIFYLDVLEHIEGDAGELARVARHLTTAGRLIVLAPAHPFLFSAFDAAIGHYRRYTKATLLAAAPRGLDLRWCRMLDSVGFFASLGNRTLLRSAEPGPAEIAIWDRMMVPVSRVIDPAIRYRFGKSIVAVWLRTDQGIVA
jgi:SAM-dependent methyltransferase